MISNERSSWKCALDYCNVSNDLDIQLDNDRTLYKLYKDKGYQIPCGVAVSVAERNNLTQQKTDD